MGHKLSNCLCTCVSICVCVYKRICVKGGRKKKDLAKQTGAQTERKNEAQPSIHIVNQLNVSSVAEILHLH